jgi:hypothetical protein
MNRQGLLNRLQESRGLFRDDLMAEPEPQRRAKLLAAARKTQRPMPFYLTSEFQRIRLELLATCVPAVEHKDDFRDIYATLMVLVNTSMSVQEQWEYLRSKCVGSACFWQFNQQLHKYIYMFSTVQEIWLHRGEQWTTHQQAFHKLWWDSLGASEKAALFAEFDAITKQLWECKLTLVAADEKQKQSCFSHNIVNALALPPPPIQLRPQVQPNAPSF